MGASQWKRNIDEQAAELLHGTIDMHVHANPHVSAENHMLDAIEIAKLARDAGMRAMVIKDVTFPNTGTAYLVNKIVPGFRMFSSLVMNLVCGGINPRAVSVAVNHGDGAKIIYFPTGDALHHVIDREKINYTGINLPLTRDEAITVTKDGKITKETLEVLEIIAGADVCLATAHVSPEETLTVVPKAMEMGVKKILISHTMWRMLGFTKDHLDELKKYDVFFEFEFQLCLPLMQFIHEESQVNPNDIIKTMRAVGIERSVMNTDTGQAYAPSPSAAMKYFIAVLLKCGVKGEEITQMAGRNPATLLGI